MKSTPACLSNCPMKKSVIRSLVAIRLSAEWLNINFLLKGSFFIENQVISFPPLRLFKRSATRKVVVVQSTSGTPKVAENGTVFSSIFFIFV